jgi:hypothetical protein
MDSKELSQVYMQMLESPEMLWVTWISIAIVIVVTLIAWKKGLSVFRWFVYAIVLGPVALVHILFKSDTHGPSQSPKAL